MRKPPTIPLRNRINPNLAYISGEHGSLFVYPTGMWMSKENAHNSILTKDCTMIGLFYGAFTVKIKGKYILNLPFLDAVLGSLKTIDLKRGEPFQIEMRGAMHTLQRIERIEKRLLGRVQRRMEGYRYIAGPYSFEHPSLAEFLKGSSAWQALDTADGLNELVRGIGSDS